MKINQQPENITIDEKIKRTILALSIFRKNAPSNPPNIAAGNRISKEAFSIEFEPFLRKRFTSDIKAVGIDTAREFTSASLSFML